MKIIGLKTYISFIFISIIAILNLSKSMAQLVNIESKHMQTDSIRFALKADLMGKYVDNNGSYLYSVRSAITSQLKTKDLKKIFFLVGDYKVIRTKGKDFQNSWFAHLRYNQKITNLFRIEAFIQDQNNQLLEINSRKLIGGGVRLKLISENNFKAYFGNSYMYETEKSDRSDKRYYNHRNSSYLSLSFHFVKSKLSLTNTSYFQPLYEDFSNYRILEQFRADLPISKYLSLITVFNYFINSKTPSGDTDTSSSTNFGLSVRI